MTVLEHSSETAELVALLFSPRYLDAEPRIAWGTFVWDQLAQAGAVPAEVEVDHPDYSHHLLTLATVAHITETVSEISAGEPIEDKRPYPEGLDHKYYGVSDRTVGRWAERFDIVCTEYPESRAEILDAVLAGNLGPVVRQLVAAMGSVEDVAAGIFAVDMRWTEWREERGEWIEEPRSVRYPLTSVDRAEALNAPLESWSELNAAADACDWLEARAR